MHGYLHIHLCIQISQKRNCYQTLTLTVNGIDLPLYLIGDSAYPLQTWLMKPFPHNGILTRAQKTYNYRLSRARIVVENVYGRLKARWRRLMKRNDMHISHIPTVTAAACILHNMCEVHGERFNDAWLQDMICSGCNSSESPTSACRDGPSERPKQIRDALVHYFSTE